MKYFVVLSLILHSVLSQEIGDNCQIPSEKSTQGPQGICLILKDCTTALADLKKGKLPYICGYRQLEAIVCCPNNTPPKVEIRVQKLPQIQKVSQIQKEPSNPNRISTKKCVEYGRSVYKMTPQLSMEGQHMVNVSKCANRINPMIEESIYAKSREFPHMALVGVGPANKKQWICSGSLISEQFVLTVAHCTTHRFSGQVKWVRLGDLDFESPNDDSLFYDFSIVQITKHPQYRAPVLYNDIALLELDRRVSFSEYIRPACLHTGNDDMLDKFIVSGWALMEDDNRGHLRQYKQLRKVENEECNEAYKDLKGRKLKDGIVEELMVCTEEARNDACRISSGAAIQTYNNDVYCMYDIVGITSFTKGICASQPVVHTRVSAYIDWIEDIVWPQDIQM